MRHTLCAYLLLLLLAHGQKSVNDGSPVHAGGRDGSAQGLSQRESKGGDAANSRQLQRQTGQHGAVSMGMSPSWEASKARVKALEEQNASAQEQNATNVTPEPLRGQEQSASAQQQNATQVTPELVHKSWTHPKRRAAQSNVDEVRSAWQQSTNSSWARILKLRTLVAHLKARMNNCTYIADLADSIVSKAIEPFQERQGHLQRDFSAKLEEGLNNTEPGKENISNAEASIECALNDNKQLAKLDRIQIKAVKSSLRKSKREAKARAHALQKKAKHAARHSKHLGSALEKAQRKAGVKKHEYKHEKHRMKETSEWLQDQAEQTGEIAADLIEEQFDAIDEKVKYRIHSLRSLSKRKRVQRELKLRQAMSAIEEARIEVQKKPMADNQTAIDQNKSVNQTATGQSRATRHTTDEPNKSDKLAVVDQSRDDKKTAAGEDRPDNQLPRKTAIDQGGTGTQTAASRSMPDREGAADHGKANDQMATGQSKGEVAGGYAQEPAVVLAGQEPAVFLAGQGPAVFLARHTSSLTVTTLIGYFACFAVVVTLAIVVQLRLARSRQVRMARYPALG